MTKDEKGFGVGWTKKECPYLVPARSKRQ